jgi:hypothetical protein
MSRRARQRSATRAAKSMLGLDELLGPAPRSAPPPPTTTTRDEVDDLETITEPAEGADSDPQ